MAPAVYNCARDNSAVPPSLLGLASVSRCKEHPSPSTGTVNPPSPVSLFTKSASQSSRPATTPATMRSSRCRSSTEGTPSTLPITWPELAGHGELLADRWKAAAASRPSTVLRPPAAPSRKSGADQLDEQVGTPSPAEYGTPQLTSVRKRVPQPCWLSVLFTRCHSDLKVGENRAPFQVF